MWRIEKDNDCSLLQTKNNDKSKYMNRQESTKIIRGDLNSPNSAISSSLSSLSEEAVEDRSSSCSSIHSSRERRSSKNDDFNGNHNNESYVTDQHNGNPDNDTEADSDADVLMSLLSRTRSQIPGLVLAVSILNSLTSFPIEWAVFTYLFGQALSSSPPNLSDSSMTAPKLSSEPQSPKKQLRSRGMVWWICCAAIIATWSLSLKCLSFLASIFIHCLVVISILAGRTRSPKKRRQSKSPVKNNSIKGEGLGLRYLAVLFAVLVKYIYSPWPLVLSPSSSAPAPSSSFSTGANATITSISAPTLAVPWYIYPALSFCAGTAIAYTSLLLFRVLRHEEHWDFLAKIIGMKSAIDDINHPFRDVCVSEINETRVEILWTTGLERRYSSRRRNSSDGSTKRAISRVDTRRRSFEQKLEFEYYIELDGRIIGTVPPPLPLPTTSPYRSSPFTTDYHKYKCATLTNLVPGKIHLIRIWRVHESGFLSAGRPLAIKTRTSSKPSPLAQPSIRPQALRITLTCLKTTLSALQSHYKSLGLDHSESILRLESRLAGQETNAQILRTKVMGSEEEYARCSLIQRRLERHALGVQRRVDWWEKVVAGLLNRVELLRYYLDTSPHESYLEANSNGTSSSTMSSSYHSSLLGLRTEFLDQRDWGKGRTADYHPTSLSPSSFSSAFSNDGKVLGRSRSSTASSTSTLIAGNSDL